MVIKNKNGTPMIFVEGNVGVGKSSFLRILNEKKSKPVFYEPSELWENIKGHNLLEAFFQDQQRWAYTLQSYIFLTLIDQMKTIHAQYQNRTICFAERSIYSGRYVFAEVAKEIKTMNDLEISLFHTIWQDLHSNFQGFPVGFIYLRTSVQTCYERILKRGRVSEDPITLDYLNRLQEKYDDWFIKKVDDFQNLTEIPVLILDFSLDFKNDVIVQDQYLKKLDDFVSAIAKKLELKA